MRNKEVSRSQVRPSTRELSAGHPKRPRLIRISLITGVFLLAAFFRFHDVGTAPPGLFSDEAADAIDAAHAAQTGQFAVFYPGNHGREGLYINVEALLLRLITVVDPGPFRLEAWMARLPSALFGTLTVVGLFFLTRVLCRNDFAAGAAAFFAATSFWHVNLSRLGVRPVSSAAFLVWALFFLLLGFSADGRARSRRGWIWITLGGALYGAGFHTYIAYRITPVIIAAVLIWLARKAYLAGVFRAWMAGTALFLGVALVAALPLGLYFLQHPADLSARTSQVSVLTSHSMLGDLATNAAKTALMLNIAGDQNPRHNIPGRPQLFVPVGLLLIGGIAVGIGRVWRRSEASGAYALCFIWIVAGAIPAVLSNQGIPHALRSCLMIPPCMILAGMFAESLRLWAAARFPRVLCLGAVCALAFLIVAEGYVSYFDTFVHDPRTVAEFHQQEAEMARQIAGAPVSIPKYFLLVGVSLDTLGNPEGFENVALLSGAYTPELRDLQRIHFITTAAEADRVRRMSGALIWAIRQ